MDFEIREMKNLSGAKARVYSVILDGDENTLLEQFFNENIEYINDLKKVLYKIHVMANDTGCRKSYLKKGKVLGLMAWSLCKAQDILGYMVSIFMMRLSCWGLAGINHLGL